MLGMSAIGCPDKEAAHWVQNRTHPHAMLYTTLHITQFVAIRHLTVQAQTALLTLMCLLLQLKPWESHSLPPKAWPICLGSLQPGDFVT